MMGNIHKSCFIESKNPYGYFFPWPSIKTEGIFAATRMDLEIIIVSKLDQTKTNTIRYLPNLLICGIFKKWYKWTHIENSNRPTHTENKFMATKREKEGEE